MSTGTPGNRVASRLTRMPRTDGVKAKKGRRGLSRVLLIPVLVATALAIFVGAAAGRADTGAFHDGGSSPGAQFCAPSGGCPGDSKTRDAWDIWDQGQYAYIGLWRDSAGGWEAYESDSSGYDTLSTYSDVRAVCGNNDISSHQLACYTNNL